MTAKSVCQPRQPLRPRVAPPAAVVVVPGCAGSSKLTKSLVWCAPPTARYVWKLLYIYMLGYEVEFGHMEARPGRSAGVAGCHLTSWAHLPVAGRESHVVQQVRGKASGLHGDQRAVERGASRKRPAGRAHVLGVLSDGR